MKIDDHQAFEAARVAGTQPVQKVGNFDLFAAYQTQGPPGADQAHLSVQGQEIQALTEKVKALPDIRDAKVDAVQAKLDAGNYEVPAADLAEAMFRLSEIDP